MSKFGSGVMAVAALSSVFVAGCSSSKRPVMATPEDALASVSQLDRQKIMVPGKIKFAGVEPVSFWDGSPSYVIKFEVQSDKDSIMKCNFQTQITSESGDQALLTKVRSGAFNGYGAVEGRLVKMSDGNAILVIENLDDIQLSIRKKDNNQRHAEL